MKGNPVILLSSVGNLTQALRRAANEQTIIICLDEIARQLAQRISGKQPYSVAEYLDLSETELRQCANDFSLQWYQASGIDYSAFGDLSAGELFIVEVTYKALFELERMIVLIQKIMQVHAPTSWILATNENKLFSQVIEAHYSTPIRPIQVRPNLGAWIRRNLNFRELKLWLRQEGWDYHFRAASFQLLKLWRKNKTLLPQKTNRGMVLFVVDIPTSSAMDTLIPIMREIPSNERLIIASDPRCYQLLKEANLEGVPFSPQTLNVAPPPAPLATRQEINQRWHTLSQKKATLDSQLTFRGIDLWKIRKNYFKNQFLRKIPIALSQFQLASEVLKTYQVRAVVSATDNHYMGQLFVRAAHKQDIYSLTIQHGMVNHPEGYLPIRASQLAVMGEAVRDWLIRKGAAPQQVVVTGQPRFDALVTPPDISRTKLLEELELSELRPTWLIAPEPQLGVWMRDLIFRTVHERQDIQAIIRVHPNDNPLDYKIGLNAYPDMQNRVRISREHDIKSTLNGCDVVLLGRSTIGLEALMLGKYLIVIHPENGAGWILPPYLYEYLDMAPYLGASTPEAISKAWDALQAHANQSELEKLRRNLINRYACNNDGKNAQRVAQLLNRSLPEIL